MADILCLHCRNFAPALDPNIARAFLGACKKKEAPFLLILPPEGVTECDVYEEGPRVELTAIRAGAEAKPAAAKAAGGRRVELYYSSRQAPGEQFPCNIERALALLGQLREKGIEATARDVAGEKDLFPIYHRAVTGPSAARRAVFGMKGALEEDFGRRVPALMIFEGERYPTEVFPRMDREANRVVGIEEALGRLLGQ